MTGNGNDRHIENMRQQLWDMEEGKTIRNSQFKKHMSSGRVLVMGVLVMGMYKIIGMSSK
jgi:hypothetical protein